MESTKQQENAERELEIQKIINATNCTRSQAADVIIHRKADAERVAREAEALIRNANSMSISARKQT